MQAGLIRVCAGPPSHKLRACFERAWRAVFGALRIAMVLRNHRDARDKDFLHRDVFDRYCKIIAMLGIAISCHRDAIKNIAMNSIATGKSSRCIAIVFRVLVFHRDEFGTVFGSPKFRPDALRCIFGAPNVRTVSLLPHRLRPASRLLVPPRCLTPHRLPLALL